MIADGFKSQQINTTNLYQRVQLEEKAISVKKKSKENHKQRAYLNSITSILDYAGNQITGFIVSPFIVNGLGNTMYGIYQMLNQMTGYANMADTRASQVLKWTVAQKREIASKEELKNELTTALVVTLITLPIILLIGAIITWYAPIIAQAPKEYFNLVRITCALMVSSLVIYQAFSLFESLLMGMNLGFKGMGIRTVIVAFGGLLKVLAITQGYGLIGLGATQLFIAFITVGVFYLIVKKNVDWFGFGKTNRAEILSYTKVSGWFMAFSLSNMALMNSDKLLLGYIVGPEFVTVFVLTLFSIKAVGGIVNAIVIGIIPGVSKFFGNGEFEKVKEARSLLISLIWLFVTMFGVALLLYNESFLLLWVGDGKYAGTIENFLLLYIGIQSIFYFLDSTFINATLDMKTKVYLTAASSLISVILAFILAERYSLIGMCLSILIGRSLLTIGYPIILKNKMNERASFFTEENIRPILVGLLFFSVASYISEWIEINNWIILISLGALTVLISAALFWFLGLTSINRRKILETVSKIQFFKLKNVDK